MSFDEDRTASYIETAEDIIYKIGIPENINGFQYLRTAIAAAAADSSIIEWGTKPLYDVIAQKYGSTAQRVDGAIRRAVMIAWERGNAEALHEFFGYTVQNSCFRPSNAEFIAMLADHVRLKYKMYN